MDDEGAMHEPMDDSLRDLAAMNYNTPDGAVPREEMWARISAARRASRAVDASDAGAERSHIVEPVDIAQHRPPARVIPIDSRRRTIQRWSAALAAGLVLGIAVDRALVGRASSHGAAQDSTRAVQVAQGNGRATSTRDSTPASTSDSANTATPTQSITQRVAPSAPPDHASHPSIRESARGHDVPRSADPSRYASAPNGSTAQPAPDPRDLYHAAAVQTLVQAEALLTAYRRGGDATDPQSMQQAARWARDVLSSTRLLMDSPAARDPQMRALFSDLELVLVQIVQLSGAPLAAPERDLIERALHDRDLLPRLRSAVPAGLATS